MLDRPRLVPILARAAAALLAAALAGCAPRPEPAFDPDTVPDAYATPSGVLMTPGSTRAWQVTADGNLYNGVWRLHVSPRAAADTAGPPKRIAAEDRWLPVLHWTRRSGPVRWDFSALAVAEPAPLDSQLVASIQVRATNEGAQPAPASLALALEPGEPGTSWVAWDGSEEPPRWNGGDAGAVHAWREGATGGDRSDLSWTLAPGEARDVRLLLPAYPTDSGALDALGRRTHATLAADVRARWRAEIGAGTSFALGDPEVENALRAATVVLLCLRERRGPDWVPIGNPFQYRDVWLRDGARAITALAVTGQTRVARELALGFLLLQWPNGAFLSQRGQLDGSGQALWAIEQAWLRPPAAKEDLKPLIESVVAGARWFALQRELGSRIGGTFPQLLPFAEPRDGELTRAQLLGNDAWAVAGLRSASRVLDAAGFPDEARQVQSGCDTWRAAFAEALEKCGQPDLPASWQGLGRDWGNYAAAWPCAALAPDDPRVAAFASRVWAAGGGPGLTFYAHPDSLHGYLGADLGVWAMRTGRRDDADRVLDAHLRWRTATGEAAELFDRTGHFGGNLPPHPSSAAALVMLVRQALIDDDGDTLRLTLGARERWWKGAEIRRAPTRFGMLDLRFSREGDRARWSWTPVDAWTALTLPPGTVLAGAPAAPFTGAAGGTVVKAPPGTRSLSVALAPERER